MIGSKTSRTAIGAAIGTALTLAFSSIAFTPAFATPVAPTVQWNVAANTINPGGSYAEGQVPAAPTCTAVTAELDVTTSCMVSVPVTTPGVHSLTATATVTSTVDASVATTQATLTYTVNAAPKGFYSPVKMGVQNVKKGGSTVPLKFKVYQGTTRAKNASAISSFVASQVDCKIPTTVLSTIDLLSSKGGKKHANVGHSLKYYGKAFHLNWKTPKAPGACYLVTMTATDGSALTASFLLK